MIGFLTKLRFEIIRLLFLSIITASVFGSEANQKIQIPEIERKSFLNGMEVLFLEGDPEELPFAMMIKNGAAFDPSDKWGATYLMARMLLESFDAQFIETTMPGSKVDLFVGWDSISFFGSASNENLEKFLIELARVIANPDFKEEEFERIRSTVLEEISKDVDSPSNQSKDLFFKKVFGVNPYGHPVKGTPETIRNLYFRDIKILYRRLLMPNQTKLALFYSGDREKFFRNLSRQWGSWVRDEPAPFTFRKSTTPQSTEIYLLPNNENESQAFLRLGFLGVESGSRNAVTLQVLKEYLTLSLPDWAQLVSEESQLQGTVEMANRKMPGYVLVSIKCTPDQIVPYVERFKQEITNLLNGKIDERRFLEAKMLVTQQYTQFVTDPVRSLEAILRTDLYELGIHYIATFGIRIERISPEIFQRGLNASFPGGNFIAVIATPTLEIQDKLNSLGNVELLN